MGRERLRTALSSNEAQCLEAGGLFSRAPTPEILEWWDRLAQTVRASDDSRLLAQGRIAEKLSMDYEVRRLSALGISNLPKWIALDDNSAGYDILSYEKGSVEPVAKLIEVKSCARRPQQIFLTRNEWETAIERAPNYLFHVWILPEEKLIELTQDDLRAQIPQDRPGGQWQIAKVTLREEYEKASKLIMPHPTD